MSLPGLGKPKKDAGGGDGRFFTTTKKGEVSRYTYPWREVA